MIVQGALVILMLDFTKLNRKFLVESNLFHAKMIQQAESLWFVAFKSGVSPDFQVKSTFHLIFFLLQP